MRAGTVSGPVALCGFVLCSKVATPSTPTVILNMAGNVEMAEFGKGVFGSLLKTGAYCALSMFARSLLPAKVMPYFWVVRCLQCSSSVQTRNSIISCLAFTRRWPCYLRSCCRQFDTPPLNLCWVHETFSSLHRRSSSWISDMLCFSSATFCLLGSGSLLVEPWCWNLGTR